MRASRSPPTSPSRSSCPVRTRRPATSAATMQPPRGLTHAPDRGSRLVPDREAVDEPAAGPLQLPAKPIAACDAKASCRALVARWAKAERLPATALPGAKIVAIAGLPLLPPLRRERRHERLGAGADAGRAREADGRRAACRRLRCPTCVGPGSAMPSYAALGDANLRRVAEFLRASRGTQALSTEGAAVAAPSAEGAATAAPSRVQRGGPREAQLGGQPPSSLRSLWRFGCSGSGAEREDREDHEADPAEQQRDADDDPEERQVVGHEGDVQCRRERGLRHPGVPGGVRDRLAGRRVGGGSGEVVRARRSRRPSPRSGPSASRSARPSPRARGCACTARSSVPRSTVDVLPSTLHVGSAIDDGRPAAFASSAIVVGFIPVVASARDLLRLELSTTVLWPLMLIATAPMPNAIRTTPDAMPPYSSHFRLSCALPPVVVCPAGFAGRLITVDASPSSPRRSGHRVHCPRRARGNTPGLPRTTT